MSRFVLSYVATREYKGLPAFQSADFDCVEGALRWAEPIIDRLADKRTMKSLRLEELDDYGNGFLLEMRAAESSIRRGQFDVKTRQYPGETWVYGHRSKMAPHLNASGLSRGEWMRAAFGQLGDDLVKNFKGAEKLPSILSGTRALRAAMTANPDCPPDHGLVISSLWRILQEEWISDCDPSEYRQYI